MPSIIFKAKQYLANEVALFSDSFASLQKLTEIFMNECTFHKCFSPLVYLKEESEKSVTTNHLVILDPVVKFVYFSLREVLKNLQEPSYTTSYQIFLNLSCQNTYTKEDLILSFRFLNKGNDSLEYIDPTIKSYVGCPQKSDLNPKTFQLFDNYLTSYVAILEKFICCEKGIKLSDQNKELIHIICQEFSQYYYDIDSFHSDKARLMLEETCGNLYILSEVTSCVDLC